MSHYDVIIEVLSQIYVHAALESIVAIQSLTFVNSRGIMLFYRVDKINFFLALECAQNWQSTVDFHYCKSNRILSSNFCYSRKIWFWILVFIQPLNPGLTNHHSCRSEKKNSNLQTHFGITYSNKWVERVLALVVSNHSNTRLTQVIFSFCSFA